VRVELFGSLGATGHGHGSVPAVVLGLMGREPGTVDTEQTPVVMSELEQSHRLALLDDRFVDFDPAEDIVLHRSKRLEFHPNAMLFRAWDARGQVTSERTYYSIGGGFVLDEEAAAATG